MRVDRCRATVPEHPMIERRMESFKPSVRSRKAQKDHGTKKLLVALSLDFLDLHRTFESLEVQTNLPRLPRPVQREPGAVPRTGPQLTVSSVVLQFFNRKLEEKENGIIL